MITVNPAYKNLRAGLELPDGDLVILTGPNNSGKSAILQWLNMSSAFRLRCDYISPRRFDLSNEVAIALNTDQELENLWNSRKAYNPAVAELTAPDALRELIALPNDARARIIEWHNKYFGELKVERSSPTNDF